MVDMDKTNSMENASINSSLGMTNGITNGMTNGVTNGMTNGMASETIEIRTKDVFSFSKRKSNWKRNIALFITIMIISASIFVWIEDNENNIISIRVDNDYQEWLNLIDLGFANFGIKEKDNTLFISLERNNIMKGEGNITESYLIFLNDKESSHGYHIGYDTYEYYIDIFGNNHTIESAKGYMFDGSKNQSDWNGFGSRYSPFNLAKTNNQNQMEFSLYPIQLGKSNISNIELLIFHFDTKGNHEYSQVLDVDIIKQQELSGAGTKSEPRINYYHILDKNELHIVSEYPLAYNSIPYDIRIIKINKPSEQSNQEKLQPSKQNIEREEYESRSMATTITVDYEFHENDIIKQCGGIIYETTANITMNDNEIVMFGINGTVISIKMEGDFGTKYIQENGIRSGYGKLNLDGISPIPTPDQSIWGTDTDLEARPQNNAPTIDGLPLETSHNQWYPSEDYFVNLARDLSIAVMKDETYLYCYIRAESDNEDDSQDFAELYFDTWHYENSSPNNDSYKMLKIDSSNTTTYYEGSGSGWSSTTLPTDWNAKSWFYSPSPISHGYEFKIPLVNLSISGSWNEAGEEIGIGARIYDYDAGVSDYNVFYPSVYSIETTPSPNPIDDPSGWSDVIYSNYTLFVEETSATITIDGKLDESAWTDDAQNHLSRVYFYSGNYYASKYYYMADDTYLYFGIQMLNDTTIEGEDFSDLCFDTNHDGGLYPDSDDKLFEVDSSNGTYYFEGDGSTWQSITTPIGWLGKISYTDGKVSYEFQIPIVNLSEQSKFDNIGDEIGIHTLTGDWNGGGAYYMSYPDDWNTPPNQNDMRYDPQGWGDIQTLQIPEFNGYLPISIMMLIIAFVFIKKRKDGDDI